MTSYVWFFIGITIGCLTTGMAGMILEGRPDDVINTWISESDTARASREQTRRLNLEGKPVPAISYPAFHRFPSRHPLSGLPEIGSGFGWRPHPITGAPNLHEGLDWSAPAGTPILAAASGKVLKAGWHGGYGMLVEIAHSQSLSSRYAHAQAIHVRQGDWVGQGQMIAEVGSTGHSTGPHLHFEIRLQGVALDPTMFIGQDAGLSLR